MCRQRSSLLLILILALALTGALQAAMPDYSIEEAVTRAQAQNPDIAIARKKVQAARGGLIEARAGYLPSVVSSGLVRERQHQSDSRLRDEDYSANVRVIQNVYSGGAVSSQVAIAQLNLEKQEYEYQAVANRVAMDVLIGLNHVVLTRAKTSVTV